MHFTEIPTLGVGLAADVAGSMPNYRKLMTPSGADKIDYLSFGAHYVQQKRVAHFIADLVESRFPIVYHPVNFNLATSDDEDEEVVVGTRDIAQYTSAIWMGQDVAIWSYKKYYLGPMLIPAILDGASAKEAALKVKYLQARLPCPFLIENPPVSASIEQMHMLDFMAAVSYEADCGIVLDIGHLIGYQQATGRDLWDQPLDRFPFDRVIEVHLAGLQFSQVGNDLNIIDQHAYPVHESCWTFLDAIAPRLRSLRGLTLEQEFCPDERVLEHLRRARSFVATHGLLKHA